jgi:polyisoprenoid-binding protein YceI
VGDQSRFPFATRYSLLAAVLPVANRQSPFTICYSPLAAVFGSAGNSLSHNCRLKSVAREGFGLSDCSLVPVDLAKLTRYNLTANFLKSEIGKEVCDMLRARLVWSAFVGVMLLAALASAADTYEVDPVHSFVIFRCRNLGQAGAVFIYGRFNDVKGTIVVDKDPAKSSVNITINANSIDTGVPDRDNHLKSPDFLNTKQFPTITFKSRKIQAIGKDRYRVTGDLTLHGVTRTITVTVEKVGEGKNFKGMQVIGFQTTFTIRRSDFGMKGLMNVAADEVTLTVAIMGIKK